MGILVKLILRNNRITLQFVAQAIHLRGLCPKFLGSGTKILPVRQMTLSTLIFS